jgi:ABC-2 type transport system ATP-binding protein
MIETDTRGGAAVETIDLRHLYGERKALDGLSFSVPEGSIFGVLGPNGGGKTTTFRILSTAMLPSGGAARIFGKDVVADSASVRRSIGVVFQSPSLDRRLKVRENLIHAGHLYGMSGSTLKQRCDELLDRVGMKNRAGEVIDKLSGGLKRRVEIAKGLLHGPRLLLLDEPSTGLDPGARKDMWDYLRELRERDGVTVLLTTHLMEEAEGCDHLIILDHGKLVASGTPEQLRSEIGGDVVTVEAEGADELRTQIADRFGIEVADVDGRLRMERKDGHHFLVELMEAFPGRVTAVYLGRPTLEDVFIRRTGHRFWREEQAR